MFVGIGCLVRKLKQLKVKQRKMASHATNQNQMKYTRVVFVDGFRVDVPLSLLIRIPMKIKSTLPIKNQVNMQKVPLENGPKIRVVLLLIFFLFRTNFN